MQNFLKTLVLQRLDDHRRYHHSRINQSPHFVSAISFLCYYVLLFINPALAALLDWLAARVSRKTVAFCLPIFRRSHSAPIDVVTRV